MSPVSITPVPRRPTAPRCPAVVGWLLVFGMVLGAAGLGGVRAAPGAGDANVEEPLAITRFVPAPAGALPRQALVGRSMAAAAADLNEDGHLDLVVAKEFGGNVLLLNDGRGRFADASAERLPQVSRDSEDVAVADFDGDGHLDLVFVSEDDRVNEFYLNRGDGHFADASDRLPVSGESNAVVTTDLEGDGDADLLIGNVGQDEALLNDGSGRFTVESATRLGPDNSRTQDLELGDVDGDGDLDLVQANEDGNRLLLNDGQGRFSAAHSEALPAAPGGEETREAQLADLDNDGHLDLYLANVRFAMQRPAQDRLLHNDGQGRFEDITAAALSPESLNTVGAAFLDLDGNGALDLLRTHAFGGGTEVLINDGQGRFRDATATYLPSGADGDGIDILVDDLSGDGVLDLYLCHYRSVDRLWLGELRPRDGTASTRLWLPWGWR